MVIYIIISTFFVLAAFFNFKRSLFFWSAFSIFFNLATCLKFSPPSLTVTFALNTFFILFYLTKNPAKKLINPFTSACLILLFSYVFSAIFPTNRLGESILKIFQFVVNELIIVHVIFASLRNPKDLKFLIKCLSISILISLIYGLFTYVTKSNPIIDYEISISSSQTEEIKMISYMNTERGIRLQSLFMSPFIFSLTIVSYLYMILIANTFFKSFLKLNNKYLIGLIILVTISVFLSNSRSTILPFITITPLLLLKMPKRYKSIIIIGSVLLVLSLPFVIDRLEIITSVFDSQSKAISGSSVSMRENQFAIALKSFFESPIFGHGYGYTDILRSSNFDLYGAESVWIPLLVEQGLIGIILYLLFFKGLVSIDKFENKRILVISIPLYYLLLVTMNGAVNISLYIVFLNLAILYKLFLYHDIWKRNKSK